jgi:hypothetical protein
MNFSNGNAGSDNESALHENVLDRHRSDADPEPTAYFSSDLGA